MRISTRGRYGLKAMLALSGTYPACALSIRELSGRTGVTAAYLEQLFKTLRRAGLVHSTRGVQGGYTLARLPDQITVGQVLRVLEGSVAPIACAEEAFACAQAEHCVENALYRRIRHSIDEVIDQYTLQQMLDDSDGVYSEPSACMRAE